MPDAASIVITLPAFHADFAAIFATPSMPPFLFDAFDADAYAIPPDVYLMSI